MSSTVQTRILIISDTHCATLDQNGTAPPLPKVDLLIHCGDLTYTGTMKQYNSALDMLKSIDAPTKLVIAGNHDLSLDSDFIFSHTKKHNLTQSQAHAKVSEAKSFWLDPNSPASKAGITFLPEGLHKIFLSNGATLQIYASPYTPEFQDWAFPYFRDEDRFNHPHESLSNAKNIASNPIPSFTSSDFPPIDLLMTHGPPYGILDLTTRGEKVGCEHLLRACMRARPLVHCFGHIHEGWGAEVVRWSGEAEGVAKRLSAIEDWRDGGWKAGVEARDTGADLIEGRVEGGHGVVLDFSRDGRRQLERGRETVMVNAAIMNVRGQPVNAPFLVVVELPKGD